MDRAGVGGFGGDVLIVGRATALGVVALLAFAMAGCPQTLSDWTIGSDAGAPDGNGASTGSSGGSSGSGSGSGTGSSSGMSSGAADAGEAFIPDTGVSEAAALETGPTEAGLAEAGACIEAEGGTAVWCVYSTVNSFEDIRYTADCNAADPQRPPLPAGVSYCSNSSTAGPDQYIEWSPFAGVAEPAAIPEACRCNPSCDCVIAQPDVCAPVALANATTGPPTCVINGGALFVTCGPCSESVPNEPPVVFRTCPASDQ